MQRLMRFLIKMKTMNKFIVVIFLCLVLLTPAFAMNDTTSKKEGFNFYSSYLSSTLYPKIKSHLESNKRFLNKADAEKLSSELLMLVIDNLKENKIIIVFPPKLNIYRVENYENVGFILQVELNLLDKEESFRDLNLNLKIKKTFLIFFTNKKESLRV